MASNSEVQTKEVIAYELEKLDKEYKNIWLFQPTCPFRKIETFFECKDFLEKTIHQLLLLLDIRRRPPNANSG